MGIAIKINSAAENRKKAPAEEATSKPILRKNRILIV
jgi:hypothetical protein